MKLLALKCPECMANLKIEEGRTSCFCEYCGCKIIIDDENEEITINKNVTINKTITETKRLINDAQLIRAQNEEKENKRGYIALAICWGAILLVFLGIWLGFLSTQRPLNLKVKYQQVTIRS